MRYITEIPWHFVDHVDSIVHFHLQQWAGIVKFKFNMLLFHNSPYKMTLAAVVYRMVLLSPSVDSLFLLCCFFWPVLNLQSGSIHYVCILCVQECCWSVWNKSSYVLTNSTAVLHPTTRAVWTSKYCTCTRCVKWIVLDFSETNVCCIMYCYYS